MSAGAKRIVVEVLLSAPVDVVWHRTQTPAEHLAWDIRFSRIEYIDQKDARGYDVMTYQTNIGFGLNIEGFGYYLHTTPLKRSSFEFDSRDWKSLITRGRGIWLYETRGDRTFFKTVYDYEVRFGALGRLIDVLVFRSLIQLATEWGFESLRLWCEGNERELKRRASRFAFLRFYVARRLGRAPSAGGAGGARSWLGDGKSVDV